METYKGKQIEEFLSKVRALEIEYGLKIESDNDYCVDFFMLSYTLGKSNIRVLVERTESNEMFVDDSTDAFYCPKCGSTNVFYVETLKDGSEIFECETCKTNHTATDRLNLHY